MKKQKKKKKKKKTDTVMSACVERANVCSCRKMRPSWLRYERKILCTLGIQLNAEIRLVVMRRTGAGSHAPQKFDRLLNFFEIS